MSGTSELNDKVANIEQQIEIVQRVQDEQDKDYDDLYYKMKDTEQRCTTIELRLKVIGLDPFDFF